jgi:hypothetical protein
LVRQRPADSDHRNGGGRTAARECENRVVAHSRLSNGRVDQRPAKNRRDVVIAIPDHLERDP